jgi:hypothetical protein
VSLPDSPPDQELSTGDITGWESNVWVPDKHPPLGAFSDVEALFIALIARRRTTTIAGRWERWAVNSYLDSLPPDGHAALGTRLASAEPVGWATLL